MLSATYKNTVYFDAEIKRLKITTRILFHFFKCMSWVRSHIACNNDRLGPATETSE